MYTYKCCKCNVNYPTSSYNLSINEGVVCYECKSKKAHNKQSRKAYYKEVKTLTELQPILQLENSDKRGWEGYHLDHIVPISYGFKHNIPTSLISSIENLRFIPKEDNMNKKDILYDESITLLIKWGCWNKTKNRFAL